ncbi:hypothetical protein ACOME3_009312 [Neoechinorhynchus agilis]
MVENGSITEDDDQLCESGEKGKKVQPGDNLQYAMFIVDKKVRNLEKKIQKAKKLQSCLKEGQSLNSEQKQSVSRLSELEAVLSSSKAIRDTFESEFAALKRAKKDASRIENSNVVGLRRKMMKKMFEIIDILLVIQSDVQFRKRLTLEPFGGDEELLENLANLAEETALNGTRALKETLIWIVEENSQKVCGTLSCAKIGETLSAISRSDFWLQYKGPVRTASHFDCIEGKSTFVAPSSEQCLPQSDPLNDHYEQDGEQQESDDQHYETELVVMNSNAMLIAASEECDRLNDTNVASSGLGTSTITSPGGLDQDKDCSSALVTTSGDHIIHQSNNVPHFNSGHIHAQNEPPQPQMYNQLHHEPLAHSAHPAIPPPSHHHHFNPAFLNYLSSFETLTGMPSPIHYINPDVNFDQVAAAAVAGVLASAGQAPGIGQPFQFGAGVPPNLAQHYRSHHSALHPTSVTAAGAAPGSNVYTIAAQAAAIAAMKHQHSLQVSQQYHHPDWNAMNTSNQSMAPNNAPSSASSSLSMQSKQQGNRPVKNHKN